MNPVEPAVIGRNHVQAVWYKWAAFDIQRLLSTGKVIPANHP